MTVHVDLLPEHAPDQPTNFDFAAGFAVSVTERPESNDAEQVEPQLMPDGEDVTVPFPSPFLVTVRRWVDAVNLAVTSRDRVMDTMQTLAVPLQSSDQPTNVDPLAGVAVNVTVTLAANRASHVLPQSIPLGDDMTVPFPFPLLSTSSLLGAST